MVVKKNEKAKIIKIDARNSIIEGNMVEIPFLHYGKEKQTTNLVQYKWSDSTGREFCVEIEGSIKYGMPAPYDLDVLLALLRIKARQSSISYGKNIVTIEDVTDDDTLISFSLNEIAKELGKTSTGAILQRIKKSIHTLANTTITSESSGAVYDPKKKEYIKSEEGAIYNLLDSYVWKTQKGGPANVNKNTIRIGKFFYYSIANSYFKYFDFALYLSLGKNSIAKRMFLLLNKWKNNKSRQTIKLQTLYERIPLQGEQPDYRKKENVINASKALKRVGFVQDFKIVGDKITFTYVSQKAIKAQEKPALLKYNLFTEIQTRLEEHGFTLAEIMTEHINVITANMEYTKALLRYTDEVFENNLIQDKKAYLERGLHSFFEIDKRYYNAP